MSSRLVYYKTKKAARAALTDENSGKLIGNRNITKYFITNNYKTFFNLILNENIKDFYEFIYADRPVSFFLDVEMTDNFERGDILVKDAIEKFRNYLSNIGCGDLQIKTIVLKSHNEFKYSYHVIFKLYKDDINYMFCDVKSLKQIYKILGLDEIRGNDGKHIFDPCVYREGLFRTYLSSKENQSRPLVKSELSDDFDGIETFVGYTGETNYQIIEISQVGETEPTEINTIQTVINDPEELTEDDRKIILKFVKKEFHHFPNSVREIFVDSVHNCIIIALTERYCQFEEREHRSNNQYIVIDTTSAKQKCHDPICNDKRYGEITLENYPRELNQIIKRCLRVNRQELELIDKAIEDCKNYICENFDKSVNDVSFDSTQMIFRGNVNNRNLINLLDGTCPQCNVEHQIGDNGYCLKCKVCSSIFPKNQLIPIDDRYKSLNSFWMNYSQLVNNGTVNINNINIYQNGEEDFSCDVKLENSILRNAELTKLYNQVLDGHKITKMAEVIHHINKDFVYTKNHWYYFNGSIWKLDEDNLNMKKIILDSTSYLNKISNYYENKRAKDTANSQQLIKNIKSIITKIHKPGFKDDIIKEAKMFYNDPEFICKLNSKKHLVPFTDGVFDLLSGEFRETTKEDYINLTVNYPYNIETKNMEVYKFLQEILPSENVRDYVLKKMSECLNGDIPNTNFLMFIGDTGANGKSQLLNLMKLSMGELGEKVEVTLLTRKRNNANEANTEKIKLMNKRFAFLSEPEDGERINIGLLKELTGSEEIVARGLYQDSVSFVMEAKLFLACNELPEIKGEDTALWRRIRAVDFPSRFVDEPNEPNEYKIDRTLPSRMREDVSWRQTFMRILLDYYYREDIREPEEIKIRTNEYRQENNDFYSWLDENIEYSEGGLLQVKDICELYLGKSKVHSSQSSKIRKEVEKWIKEKYKNVKWEFSMIKTKEKSIKGWKDLILIENI